MPRMQDHTQTSNIQPYEKRTRALEYSFLVSRCIPRYPAVSPIFSCLPLHPAASRCIPLHPAAFSHFSHILPHLGTGYNEKYTAEHG